MGCQSNGFVISDAESNLRCHPELLSAVTLQLPHAWHAVLNLPKAFLFKSLDVTFSDFLSSKIHPSFYSYTILIWPLHSLRVNELVWLLTIPKWTFSNQEKHPSSQYNVKLYTTVAHNCFSASFFLLPTRSHMGICVWPTCGLYFPSENSSNESLHLIQFPIFPIPILVLPSQVFSAALWVLDLRMSVSSISFPVSNWLDWVASAGRLMIWLVFFILVRVTLAMGGRCLSRG